MTCLKCILLVEDSMKDIELTLEALEENNLANRVVVAKDGVQALDFLYGKGEYQSDSPPIPAVILMDIKMPRMDGIETLRAIRSDSRFKTIPVVMLTSSREEPDLKSCYELGANAYVVKPVEFKSFMDSVKNLGVFWALINEIP